MHKTKYNSLRPEYNKRLCDLLKDKLKPETYDSIVVAQGSASSAQEVVRSIFTDFENLGRGTMTGVSKGKETWRRRANRMLDGLEKVAKIGDVALQHHPGVVALAWAGFRLLLQVYIFSFVYFNLYMSPVTPFS